MLAFRRDRFENKNQWHTNSSPESGDQSQNTAIATEVTEKTGSTLERQYSLLATIIPVSFTMNC